MCPSRCLCVFGLAALVASSPATAAADEPWLLGFEVDLAAPLIAPTVERFEPGAAASVSLHLALSDAFLIGARLRGGFLSDGPAPTDPALVDPGVGDLSTLHGSLRMRPLASALPGPERGTGLFVEVGAGGALTGARVRPSLEAAVGWGFAIDGVDLGPVLRWVTVFEVDDQLEDRPAHVLLAGIELSLFDARPVVEAAAPPAPDRVRDTDGDGVPDDVDACVEDPEDIDGFEDDDGCPDEDDDADGVLDADDACPREPEDRDGFEDEDGCPDVDNDGDGIADVRDACPDQPEVVNGVDDRDGCPDEGLITMDDDRIVLPDRVLFDFSRARIRREAIPILEAVVALQAQHPEWTELRVEGHADRRGTRSGNQRLSEMRAERVRGVLVELGIPAEIVAAVGFGHSRIAYQGSSEPIHQANRRVELVVVRRRELTADEQAAEDVAAEREREATRSREER